MSTTTAVLGLKKPEGSDPFRTADFAENWQKIDDEIGNLQAAGGGGGGGITQAEGDLRYVRTVNNVGPDGAGDVAVAGGGGADYDRPYTWVKTGAVRAYRAPGTTTNFVIGTYTMPTDGFLLIDFLLEIAFYTNQTQTITMIPKIDGLYAFYPPSTSPQEQSTAGLGVNFGQAGHVRMTVPLLGGKAVVAGARNVSVDLTIGSSVGGNPYVYGWQSKVTLARLGA